MNTEKRRRLVKAYRLIPVVECKGLCQGYCGVIGMAPVEEEYLLEVYASLPDPGPGGSCDKLTAEGRCSVYDRRPFVCRAFGAVDHRLMTCPHGCEVKGGKLPNARSSQILANIQTM